MKKLTAIVFFSGILFSSVFAQKDPAIMTVDDKSVTKSEFLQIYLKNNPYYIPHYLIIMPILNLN